MADRRPLAVVSGTPAEIPSGDTIPDAVIPAGITRDTELSAHTGATTSVHGITNTADLATDSDVSGAISTHAGLSDPHPVYLLESAAAAVATSGSASDLGSGTLGTARLPRVLNNVQNIGSTLTGTINTDASSGSNFRDGTMTGDVTLAVPSNATDGQVLHFRLLASGARTITLNGSIVNGSGATFPLPVASGKLGRIALEYNGLLSAWVCTAALATP